MLRKLSNVRRRVEQLATEAVSGRCNGHHRRHRVVHVSNDDPTPAWPEEAIAKRCTCGAELEFFTIVHQQIPERRPEPPGSARPGDTTSEADVLHEARRRNRP